MSDSILDLVKNVHRRTIEQLSAEVCELRNEATIQYTQLPSLPPDCEFFHEWNTYRDHVEGLIAKGMEGTWVVVKGDRIIFGFSTWKLAYLAGLAMIANNEIRPPFLLHQVRTIEKASCIEEYRLQCPNSTSRLARSA